MRIEDYQQQLDELYNELEKVEAMSELEACEFGNSNSKQEYLECIQSEIDFCENQIRELGESEEIAECSTYHLDPAFSSWAQVNAMFV